MQIKTSLSYSTLICLCFQLLYMFAATSVYVTVADLGRDENIPSAHGDESSSDPVTISGDTTAVHSDAADGSDLKSNFNREQQALQLYRRLFRQKRTSHIEAVKKIIGLNSEGKQLKMLQAIFGKLFEVFKEARVKLMEASFVPGDSFPFEENIVNVFSMVLENTVFLGDLALRLPDVAHSLLDTNSDWKSLTSWAVAFCNDTRVLVGKDAEHLSLMAQELGIIEKHPSFVNPFKKETIVSQVVDSELQRILSKEKRKLQKKEQREQKKKSKGPRLSRHTEL